jgi:hypothetical protein
VEEGRGQGRTSSNAGGSNAGGSNAGGSNASGSILAQQTTSVVQHAADKASLHPALGELTGD